MCGKKGGLGQLNAKTFKIQQFADSGIGKKEDVQQTYDLQYDPTMFCAPFHFIYNHLIYNGKIKEDDGSVRDYFSSEKDYFLTEREYFRFFS